MGAPNQLLSKICFHSDDTASCMRKLNFDLLPAQRYVLKRIQSFQRAIRRILYASRRSHSKEWVQPSITASVTQRLSLLTKSKWLKWTSASRIYYQNLVTFVEHTKRDLSFFFLFFWASPTSWTLSLFVGRHAYVEGENMPSKINRWKKSAASKNLPLAILGVFKILVCAIYFFWQWHASGNSGARLGGGLFLGWTPTPSFHLELRTLSQHR
jgi:hypothetical protein